MSSRSWIGFLSALAFVAFCPVGAAQTPKSEEPNEVETRKGREPSEPEPQAVAGASRADLSHDAAPRSSSVITSEEIRERQAGSVPEALQEMPGVYVQQTNRGAGAPIVRGLIGPQNLILVDGVRFNTGTFRTGPNQYLATIDPFALERIEVVRGPAAVLYGSGAMGGVFHLVTEQPDIKGGHGASARLSGWLRSADASPGGTLSLAAKADDLTLSGGGTMARFGELRAGGGDVQPLSAYTAGSWRAKATQRLGKSMTLTGAYFGTTLDDAGRTDRLGRGDVRLYDNDDHLAYAALTYESKGPVRRVRVLGSYHRMDETGDRFSCDEDEAGAVADLPACISFKGSAVEEKRRYRDVVDTAGAEIDVALSLLGNRLELVGGFEVYHDWVGSSRQDALRDDGFAWRAAPRGNFSDGSTYRTLGVFLHADLMAWDVGPNIGQVHLTGGGRFSDFAAHAPDVPSIGDVSYSDSGFAGAASLQLLRPDLYNFYASFNQGFRAPSLQETTAVGDTGSKFEIPNGELAPERIDTVEVGAKLFWGPLSFHGAWFYSFLRGAIDEESAVWQGRADVGGAPVVRRINAEGGDGTGVEGGARLSLWKLTFGAGATWTEAELKNGGETHPARRIPPVFGKASLRYDHGDDGLWLEAFSLWSGRQDALHPIDKEDLRICETRDFTGLLKDDCDGTDPWVTFNLRGGVRFLKRFRADVGLYNLTDANYRLHGSGFDMPGFDARAMLTYEM